jgi:hypothetical protein
LLNIASRSEVVGVCLAGHGDGCAVDGRLAHDVLEAVEGGMHGRTGFKEMDMPSCSSNRGLVTRGVAQRANYRTVAEGSRVGSETEGIKSRDDADG